MYGIRIGIRRRNISMVEVFKDFYSRNGMVSVKSFLNPTWWEAGGGGIILPRFPLITQKR